MTSSKRERSVPRRSVPVRTLRVLSRPHSHHGLLIAGPVAMPCTLGKNGATRRKREGDGCTPVAALKTIAWYAPRGLARLPTRGPVPKTITRSTGWCDDPRSPNYNRPVRLPARAGHESMARTDGKYDIVGVLDWNVSPRVRARGSAIFFHINDDSAKGTEGCVALTRAQMRRLLPRLSRHVTVVVT